MREKILIQNVKEIPEKKKDEHDPYVYTKREVTKRGEFDQCYVALYTIPPQKANYPFHAHMNNTEVFYIISGTGTLETADGPKNIGPGDFIVCPPGDQSAHRIVNYSESEDLVYIDFDTTHSPDIVHYPNSKKTGIIIHNQSNAFFKDATAADYYEDE